MSAALSIAQDSANLMALSELQKRVNALVKKRVKVGWFPGLEYENGESVATVAIKNEFGLGVPARPFMRPAVANNKDKWTKTAKILSKDYLDKNISANQLFNGIGSVMIFDIQQAIIDVHEPPLAASTIARRLAKYKKGSKSTTTLAKPLIDTTQMITAVNMEIEDNGN